MSGIQSIQGSSSPAEQAAALLLAQHPKPVSTPQVTATDMVHISDAGKSALNALQSAAQEATETQAQTIKEATHGDPQALRKLAAEAQAKQALG